MFNAALRSFHQLQENACIYSLTQLFGLPTIRRYRALVRQHVPQDPDRRILEIGCGVGSARPLFTNDYTGIDINPDYIEKARRDFSGRFYVMDAAHMPFEPNTFDDAISIATTHHLTDEQFSAMISKATTVASSVHIVDAILPISPNSWFKSAFFRMDRGRYARTFDQLREIVGRSARIEYHQVIEGQLHDVCYVRASRLG
jgi:SAM-dependent methyltransferase